MQGYIKNATVHGKGKYTISNQENFSFASFVPSDGKSLKIVKYLTGIDLRGSVPKNGPVNFASKNRFYFNSADGKGLVPKYKTGFLF